MGQFFLLIIGSFGLGFLVALAIVRPEGRPCPLCKNPIRPKDRFCPYCSYQVRESIIPPPPPLEKTTLFHICPYCHKPSPFLNAFCSNCGQYIFSDSHDTREINEQPAITRHLPETINYRSRSSWLSQIFSRKQKK